MPIYTYRREDGSTFDIRQSFTDSALTVDPETGQKVSKVMQSAGVIFKGSGFYVTDSKDKNTAASNGAASKDKDEGASAKDKGEGASVKPAEKASTDAKPTLPAPAAAAPSAATSASAAAD